jgi:hypothetical protein
MPFSPQFHRNLLSIAFTITESNTTSIKHLHCHFIVPTIMLNSVQQQLITIQPPDHHGLTEHNLNFHLLCNSIAVHYPNQRNQASSPARV